MRTQTLINFINILIFCNRCQVGTTIADNETLICSRLALFHHYIYYFLIQIVSKRIEKKENIKKAGFETPTEIQSQMLPYALSNNEDVFGRGFELKKINVILIKREEDILN